MLAACEAANVQFMDGVMFMHHARMQKMDAFLRGDPYNDFGEVQRVTSGFSFMGNEDFFKSNIRASSSGDPLGCLGDLGWYCVRFGLFAFGWDNKPLAVSAKKLKDASVSLPRHGTRRPNRACLYSSSLTAWPFTSTGGRCRRGRPD